MKDLKIFTENIEQKAADQIDILLSQPAFADCKVRIMPDVHAGAGCVIGFTANLGDKVIPNIVGVDIGCGILTIDLGKIDIDYEKLDNVIREYIPSGRGIHEDPCYIYNFILRDLRCYYHLNNSKRRFERSIGTLGGGNHFIEIDERSDGSKYLLIHSGSRNLGKQVCGYYQNLAIDILSGKYDLDVEQKKLIAEYKALGRDKEIQSAIEDFKKSHISKPNDIPSELCYLTGQHRDDYLHDMQICQEYAVLNRSKIARSIMREMNWEENDRFETIHNYIDNSNMVRKGAISAKTGEKVLIPINMRDGSILAIGKGNDDWNQSAPHGAGRIMSRSEARETISLDIFKKSMDGIYTTSVGIDTIDEAPMVYKPMDEIIKNIADTVDILEIIKPVYNFKASEV